jgi:hypothetical protein
VSTGRVVDAVAVQATVVVCRGGSTCMTVVHPGAASSTATRRSSPRAPVLVTSASWVITSPGWARAGSTEVVTAMRASGCTAGCAATAAEGSNSTRSVATSNPRAAVAFVRIVRLSDSRDSVRAWARHQSAHWITIVR